ncbi:hypothetical protein WA026_000418 [Henosepilachna vigintioctopunctata]|uniref:1-alkyl-2-acetylglycerophosphocholine esterase n=1 Tax=Henosepilachna vigintioctopunctata TaxID=420089 RepID=A0AAW1V8A6_9CUCU
MWGSRRKPNHLPFSRGPYAPGAMDVMLDYSKDGVFMRMYYPTNAVKDDENNYKKWIPWVADSSYIEGIANVLMLLPVVVRGLMWWSGNTYIPVLYGEKIRKDKKMKCVILSHGLGGTRFLYTNVCCELASQGFIVFALEHRDKSAANTYFYENEEHAKSNIRSFVRFKRVPLSKGHFETRNKQVNLRSSDCGRVLDFIFGLNAGNIPHNVLDDVRCKRENCDFSLLDLSGCLDVDNIIMMGHSFGGASALLTLSRRHELKLGVLLDPWMFSIKNDNLSEKVKQPLLFINTQTFHVSSNTEAMSKYLTGNHREMYTILHTTHETQSDTVLLIGYWLNWFMKKLDPQTGLRINNSLILRFTNTHIGYPENITEEEDLIKKEEKNIEKGLTKPWL